MIKHKFLTLFVALCATTALWASNVITYTATKKLNETIFEGAPGLYIYAFNVSISSHTFSNGEGTITFDGDVTTIGYSAFYKCKSLTSITIPNSVTTIGDWAFFGCDLTSVTIGNSVTSIGDGAFTYCGLTSVTIPNSVTTIGNEAFEKCSGLTSVTIGNSVTSIGDRAFAYCSGLTSITIPNSVTSIGGGAFSYCSGLSSIDVEAANTHYVSIDGVLFNYAKDTLIQYPIANPRAEHTIPTSVTTIGDYAFSDCTSLTSITIPNSVTTIGNHAFSSCSELTIITIPNSVTTIGEHAFFRCNGLTSVTIGNSVTTIGNEAFTECTRLASIIIPNSVTTIGARAFYYCSSLNSATIGNSVTTIGNEAFEDCSGLTSITIPNSVTTIGDWAFFGCSGLTSIDVDAANTHYASVDGVLFNYTKDILIQYPIGNTRTEYTIPNSVTTIGDWAFFGCSGLTSVTIPNSVTTIGNYAFTYCEGLISITCEATTPPTCGSYCFYDVDKSIPLYVPAGSVDAYKAADEWKDFTNIRPITAKDVEVTEIEAEPTESAVEIAWPSVVNAETYTIEIRLNDKLICSIVFNAQGQLVSINFNLAPGRGGHTYATTAESTATGWAYTIAGLNPGTNYTYSVIAKNADEQVIDTKSGSFTTHGMPMDIEIVNAGVNTTKFLRNGQVIIQKNGKTFTIFGQEVR